MKTVFAMLLTMALGIPAVSADTAGEFISYTVAGKPYQGYFISPSADAPLILLIHDWDGLTDYEIKRANMLADMGYAVFAADLFGAGIRPTEEADKRRLTGELYENRKKMRELLYGAMETAATRCAHSHKTVSVAMGYCFGGTAVLELARSGADLKGFVSFHGGLDIPDGQDYSDTKGQVLVFHGTADQHVTMDQFAKLANALEKYHVPHEMIAYGGAPHAFTVFGSDRYRKDADKKSWNRFMDFLRSTFR